MTAFTLDTSGTVEWWPKDGSECEFIRWSDLAPFTQGYVEALFARFWEDENDRRQEPGGNPTNRGIPAEEDYRFSDLAPETLARIMEDCRSALETRVWGNSAGDGRLFWSERGSEAFSGFFGGRQNELRERFPPLAPFLGDDGEVYLREDSK